MPGISASFADFYYNWDFGYDLFLPTEITVDNFTTGADKLTLYSDSEAVVNERMENKNLYPFLLKYCFFIPFIV